MALPLQARLYFTKDSSCQAVIGKNLAHFATFGCNTFPFTFTPFFFGIRHPLSRAEQGK